MTDRSELMRMDAQAKRAQEAFTNEMNQLGREGLPIAAILAGAGAAIQDLITCNAGPAAVAPWFDKMAELVRTLQSNS